MKCPFCKKEINAGTVSCNHCGGYIGQSVNRKVVGHDLNMEDFKKNKIRVWAIVLVIDLMIVGAIMLYLSRNNF